VYFEILLHDCCTKQKQQDIFMRIMFVGSSSLRTQDFTAMYDEKPILWKGDEDLDPHGYIQNMNPNSVCIFWHQINKSRLMDGKYWKYKKDSYSSKASLCVESYFMFFLLAILLLTSIRWPSGNNFLPTVIVVAMISSPVYRGIG
jgi:hypothetical protein